MDIARTFDSLNHPRHPAPHLNPAVMPKTNIILFGKTGVGKSSIVNMLSGGESIADTSSGSTGCTFKNSEFQVDIDGMPATLWDTVGLSANKEDRIPGSDAIVQLYELVQSLSEDGVSLLMFVTRAGRYDDVIPKNWKLLHEIICHKKVPIVIVVTGLEQEDNMDQWWCGNKGPFQHDGIYPGGVACVTASRGKRGNNGYTFDREYAESRDKIRRLIKETCLTDTWKVPAAQWFKSIVVEFVEYRTIICNWKKEVKWKENQEVVGEACQKLVSVCGMSRSDAEALAKKVRGD